MCLAARLLSASPVGTGFVEPTVGKIASSTQNTLVTWWKCPCTSVTELSGSSPSAYSIFVAADELQIVVGCRPRCRSRLVDHSGDERERGLRLTRSHSRIRFSFD
jgi:hypothetical protein